MVVDTHGVGGSGAPPAPYIVADLAGDAAGLIERLGLAPCAVAGYARLVSQGLTEMAAVGVELPMSTWVMTLLGLLFTPAQLADDALVAATYERMVARRPWRDPGRHGVCTALLAAELDDPSPRWPGIDRPVLLVAFDGDPEFPLASAAAMAAAIPEAQLAVVQGAGHGGVLTHTGEVAGHVLGFLTRRSTRLRLLLDHGRIHEDHSPTRIRIRRPRFAA